MCIQIATRRIVQPVSLAKLKSSFHHHHLLFNLKFKFHAFCVRTNSMLNLNSARIITAAILTACCSFAYLLHRSLLKLRQDNMMKSI